MRINSELNLEEKVKDLGFLFIHYCQFLALQLSSGENTIGKLELANNNWSTSFPCQKEILNKKGALDWPPGRVAREISTGHKADDLEYLDANKMMDKVEISIWNIWMLQSSEILNDVAEDTFENLPWPEN